jgi:hypothetical protein
MNFHVMELEVLIVPTLRSEACPRYWILTHITQPDLQ